MNDQSKEVQPPVLGGELKLSGEYHADVNMLLADIERLNADNVALRTAGELFAAAVPKLDAARAERDTLLAELEQLRKLPTRWSEVYEQTEVLESVLAERDTLKARCDELEKIGSHIVNCWAAAENGQMLSAMAKCIPAMRDALEHKAAPAAKDGE